jgi:hypothetical protein
MCMTPHSCREGERPRTKLSTESATRARSSGPTGLANPGNWTDDNFSDLSKPLPATRSARSVTRSTLSRLTASACARVANRSANTADLPSTALGDIDLPHDAHATQPR